MFSNYSSVVRDRDLVAFCPTEDPFLTYSRMQNVGKAKRALNPTTTPASLFLQDRAVQLALQYWDTGVAPSYFKWLPFAYSDAKLEGKIAKGNFKGNDDSSLSH